MRLWQHKNGSYYVTMKRGVHRSLGTSDRIKATILLDSIIEKRLEDKVIDISELYSAFKGKPFGVSKKKHNHGETRHCYVYFIKDTVRGLVKIGISWDVDKRLKSFFTVNPEAKYEILKMIPFSNRTAAFNKEKELHKLFHKSHFKREWFYHSEELSAFLVHLTQIYT